MQLKSLLMSATTVACCLLLSACGSSSGGYYKHDGPPGGGDLLANTFKGTPNAVPKYEPPHKFANKSYKVGGKRYYPVTGDQPMVQTGHGSWYGKMFHGKKTSTGETYNMYAMTAAHKTMELPSYAKVTNLENGRSVIVRVNDRGPFVDNRIIDLSYAAASKLGYVNKGTARVKVERIRMADIRNGRIPSTFSKVDLSSNSSSSRADALAIASVIGAAVVAHKNKSQESKTTTAQTVTTTPKETVSAPVSLPPAASPVTHEDLQGAVNLTEAAQHEMVSTEVTLQEPTASIVNTTPWRLQAGAFGTKANAQALANDLKSSTGEDVYIEQDGNLFKVLLGGFNTKEEATQKALQIEQSHGKKLVPLMVKGQ